MSKHSAKRIGAIFAICALGMLALAMAVAMVRHPVSHSFPMPLHAADTAPATGSFAAFHLLQSENWIDAPDGLAPKPGLQALRIYRLYLDDDHELELSLNLRLPQGGTNLFWIEKPDPLGEKPPRVFKRENENFQFDARNFAELSLGAGMVRVGVGAMAPAGGGSTAVALRGIEIGFSGKSITRHWGSAVFFLALTLFAYGGFLLVLLPMARDGAMVFWKFASRRFPRDPVWASVAAAVVIAAIFSVPFFALLSGEKKFDDRAALGNAGRLLDSGFDTSEMFFRSRMRPALTAWHLPWVGLLPHALAHATFTPSDDRSRMFYIHDRLNARYGAFEYVEESVFFAAMLLAATLGLAGMAARWAQVWPEHRWSMFFGVWMILFMFSRMFGIFYNTLSEPADLAVWIVAAFLAVESWQGSSNRRVIAAGATMGFSMLMKESSVALASAVGLFQLWTWHSAEDDGLPDGNSIAPAPFRQRLVRFGVYWAAAAALPLIYFGLVLDTGFGELWTQRTHLAFTQELHGLDEYPPLTIVNVLKAYWLAFGAFLPFAAIGVAIAILDKSKSTADRFFLCWMAASLWILTLPFLLPRFLILYIPPFAWFSCRSVLGAFNLLLSHGKRLERHS